MDREFIIRCRSTRKAKAALTFLCALLRLAAWASDDLLAFYRFDSNGDDSLGQCPPFVLTNAWAFALSNVIPVPPFAASGLPISNGVFHVDGRYDPNGSQRNYLSQGGISHLNFNSFAISLDFCPRPDPLRPLPFQQKLDRWTFGRYSRLFGRGHDPNLLNTANIITGGPGYRWFGLSHEGDVLNLTLNNRTFVHRFEESHVKPNLWHNVICSVDIQHALVLVSFDGRQLAPVALPASFRLSLPVSSLLESERKFTFTDYSCGSVFFGSVANLKIFARAMSPSELQSTSAKCMAERPEFMKTKSPPWLMVVPAFFAVAVVFIVRRAKGHRQTMESKIH